MFLFPKPDRPGDVVLFNLAAVPCPGHCGGGETFRGTVSQKSAYEIVKAAFHEMIECLLLSTNQACRIWYQFVPKGNSMSFLPVV